MKEKPPRGKRITFSADGRTIDATAGQSVGAALWAHGDRILSRSTKYHRPRGWSCGTGKCGNCLMRIDGLPNRRACMVPVAEGMDVQGQNAWPSVRRDIWRANDIVFRRGFDHHRGFVRPRFLYPLFGTVIRAFAGWGRLPERVPPAPRAAARRAQVVVIGAGPAGLAAATAADAEGAKVLLLDEHAQAGGAAAWLTRSVADPDTPEAGPVPMAHLVARWREAATSPNIQFLPRTSLVAAYPGHLLLAHSGQEILAIRADATIVATGGTPTEALFPNNDLPGIMTTTGCLTLLNRDHVMPGRRAVVYGAGAHGLATALELHRARIAVQCIVEPTAAPPGPEILVDEVETARIPLHSPARIERAHGWGRLRAVTLRDADGTRNRVKADLLVVALGQKTLPVVFQAMGARLAHEARRGGTLPVVNAEQETSVPGLFASGDAAGITSLRGARESGRIAGGAAARHVTAAPSAEATERKQAAQARREEAMP